MKDEKAILERNHQHNIDNLFVIKKIIESAMENEIDLDPSIPDEIINDMAKTHSDINKFLGIKTCDGREYREALCVK